MAFAPPGLVKFRSRTHGLRRGLHSTSAPRLAFPCPSLIAHRSWLTAHGSRLKAKQVTHLHEKLAAVVEIAAGSVGDVAGRDCGSGDDIQILQVAVVADVDGGARMHEISDQKVGVELF